MVLTVAEKLTWVFAVAVSQLAVAAFITLRKGLVKALVWWMMGILAVHVPFVFVIVDRYQGQQIVPQFAARPMDAFGAVISTLLGYIISEHIKLDLMLYLAGSSFLIGFFCFLMLLRPVTSDAGIQYAITGWLINLTIRDFGYKSVLTPMSCMLGFCLVVARLVLELVEGLANADGPPLPGLEEEVNNAGGPPLPVVEEEANNAGVDDAVL
uniref:Putative ovule protein n=1 Tax=Solanum chacoense TaxID=4108 RepID=A0A0V0HJ12_SOLCH